MKPAKPKCAVVRWLGNIWLTGPTATPYKGPMSGAQQMLKYAEKSVVRRAPLAVRPQPEIDRKALREVIIERFSKSLEYLGR